MVLTYVVDPSLLLVHHQARAEAKEEHVEVKAGLSPVSKSSLYECANCQVATALDPWTPGDEGADATDASHQGPTVLDPWMPGACAMRERVRVRVCMRVRVRVCVCVRNPMVYVYECVCQ